MYFEHTFPEKKLLKFLTSTHQNSLQQKVQPMVMHIQPEWFTFNSISVRIPPQNIKTTMRSLEAAWKRVLPNHPIEYSFVDEEFDKQYKTERQLTNLSVIFSILIIFISCLGLLGLTTVAVSHVQKRLAYEKCWELRFQELLHFFQKIL